MGKENIYKLEGGKLLLSTTGMEKAFGVSRQALSNWEQSGCPKQGRGWWDLNQVIGWKIDREVGLIRSEYAMTDKDRKLLYEADLKKAQAEAAEFKNAITRGDYLEKAAVVQDLSRFFDIFKKASLGIPRKVATEISPFVDADQARSVESMLGEVMRETLEGFSNGHFAE